MNKYLKRGATIALTGAMCLSMAACGEKGGSKSGKNDTKTLAQELGYGYLSEYHKLDTDLDWITAAMSPLSRGKCILQASIMMMRRVSPGHACIAPILPPAR